MLDGGFEDQMNEIAEKLRPDRLASGDLWKDVMFHDLFCISRTQKYFPMEDAMFHAYA